ncbi:TetR/AcrR family transcriptional regulator [Corallincola platygyrae]
MILAAALELFTERGFQATSTALIAKTAGVATGTLFHHFESKEALINQLYLDIKLAMATAMVPEKSMSSLSSVEQLKVAAAVLWRQALEWCITHHKEARFFAQYNHSPYIDKQTVAQAQTQVLGFVTELIEQGQAIAIFKPLPAPLLYEVCHGLMLQTAFFYIEAESRPSETDIEQTFGLLWDALHA